MMLVDYDDAAHERGVGFAPALPTTSLSNQQKIFNIRSRFVASDNLQMIDSKLQKIEVQMKKLIKNSKINSDDKLMYITGLIKKYGDLKALRRSEIEKSDANFIEKIKNSSPQSVNEEKKKNPSLVTIDEKIAKISSILKNTPRHRTPLKRPNLSNVVFAEDKGAEDDLIIPKSLFQSDGDDSDDDDDESVYEDVDEGPEEQPDEPMNISAVKGLKRSYSTPMPSVGRRKRFKAVAKKIGMIKTWDLRPAESRKLKRKLAALKMQKRALGEKD